MKTTLALCFAALVLLGTAQSNAQPIQVGFAYCGESDPLGCGCDAGTRVPFADGSNSWCVMWDRNGNGPDDADQLIPEAGEYGGANYQCSSFNGLEICGLEGNFAFSEYLTIGIPPEAPDASIYYIKINGGTCCWVSDTFHTAVGLQEFYLTAADWTCEDEGCSFLPAPNPVSNVQVSSDDACLQVLFSWDHDGENLTGFNLYVRNSEDDPWEFRGQIGPTLREGGAAVCADGPVYVGIQAINGSEEAEIVSATGATYHRHYEQDILPNVSGLTYAVDLVRPPSGSNCSAFLWFDYYTDGSFVERVLSVTNFEDALTMSFEVTLPSTPNASSYLVMIDSVAEPQGALVGCGLTDTAYFPNAAGDPTGLIREFALQQNYPNPFNPNTTIEFSLPNAGEIELAVFNLSGQRVATLYSGSAAAGVHRVDWSANGASSGMYFYRLQMGNQVLTRKMLLMK
ncbi:MAG: T9SS type A sorting domain-containing protein [Calditrichaeota bacterium]|nr:T9SS type A sorting domain-containing protein [Calditrichota bacterium]MCB9366936.1 T9SS type A sorting domain-containing protein [Calditrichota bacterium]